VAALAVVAQTQHVTPFTGTWKMNLAKSRFNPGPPFQSFTLTFTSDGVRHLDLVPADGKRVNIALPWSAGNPVSPEGMENAVTTSKIQGRTFHDIWKQNGKIIEDVRGRVSPDGKTLNVTVDGTNVQGRTYHNELTFDRQ